MNLELREQLEKFLKKKRSFNYDSFINEIEKSYNDDENYFFACFDKGCYGKNEPWNTKAKNTLNYFYDFCMQFMNFYNDNNIHSKIVRQPIERILLPQGDDVRSEFKFSIVNNK